MKVLLRGVHLTLSDRTKAYVEEHLVEPIRHFYEDEAAELDVGLIDNNGPKGGIDKECSVTLRMPGLQAIHITEAAETLFEAIDRARDRLVRVAKRTLERRREMVGTDGLPADAPGMPPLS